MPFLRVLVVSEYKQPKLKFEFVLQILFSKLITIVTLHLHLEGMESRETQIHAFPKGISAK